MAEVKPVIPNVLAARYASPAMAELWSAEHKVVLERQLWLAVLRAQADLGHAVEPGVIEAYEAVVDQVDLASIAEREAVTRHDVKARIEEFSALAGHEAIHAGMTSRDLTENVEQLQARDALRLVRSRMVTLLARLAELAAEHATTVMTGRSHNVPAQATTLGKRFANAGEEVLQALHRVDDLLARYPLRGIKGPMGTQQDMLDLLGTPEQVDRLETAVARHLGFDASLTNVGQVYPRSLDLDVVAALVQAVAGPASLATTIRLMAGQELVTEGFQAGQVGSSAMPHKMNTRSCERIVGLSRIVGGHLAMVAALAGDQWNEGDVSCSVVRRVALPDAFFATDGVFETMLTVLDEFGAYPAVIERELARYLPFLATTKVLMAAVRAGVGRETAHEVIKQHAVEVALAMREKGAEHNDLLERLAADERLGLDEAALRAIVAEPIEFVGNAERQTAAFVATVADLVAADPDAAAYRPAAILLEPAGQPPFRRRFAPVSGRGLHAETGSWRLIYSAEMTDAPAAIYSGKVRDIYDAGDDRLLMVTSDRISAFDVVLDEPVPDKGRVLTAMSAFWFAHLADVCGSHLISTDLADLPASLQQPEWAGRVMLCHKAEMLPVECIVRGYITGSAWKEYKTKGTMHGSPMPAGIQESQALPEPVFTPSTKAEVGDHDENISFEQAANVVGAEMATRMRDISIELYKRGVAWAAERGIIIADTKFELGLVDGELVVCDEVLTPDSSRFWPANEWIVGATPPSFDKQPVRDYLDGLDWDKTPPPPPLPEGVVTASRERYVAAYEQITGLRFSDWAGVAGPEAS